MTTSGALSCSVGRDGQNLYGDTKNVQTLLNREIRSNRTYASAVDGPLDTDGKCGSLTIAAIQSYQSSVMRWGAQSCDGRIDPGGKTWRKLNGNVASPAAIVPIPVTREIQGAAAASAGSNDFSFFPYGDAFFDPIPPMIARPPSTESQITKVKQGNIKGTLGSGKLSISGYGCALCTLTMAANAIGARIKHWPDDLKPADLTPLKANKIIDKAGGFSDSLLIMTTAAKALGMKADQYGHGSVALPAPDVAYAQVTAHLRNYPVAANVDYKKGAAGDHWVLLTSISGKTINAIDPATGKKMTFSSTNTDRTRTTNKDTGFLFGADGSANQKNYAVIRYILLSPTTTGTVQ